MKWSTLVPLLWVCFTHASYTSYYGGDYDDSPDVGSNSGNTKAETNNNNMINSQLSSKPTNNHIVSVAPPVPQQAVSSPAVQQQQHVVGSFQAAAIQQHLDAGGDLVSEYSWNTGNPSGNSYSYQHVKIGHHNSNYRPPAQHSPSPPPQYRPLPPPPPPILVRPPPPPPVSSYPPPQAISGPAPVIISRPPPSHPLPTRPHPQAPVVAFPRPPLLGPLPQPPAGSGHFLHPFVPSLLPVFPAARPPPPLLIPVNPAPAPVPAPAKPAPAPSKPAPAPTPSPSPAPLVPIEDIDLPAGSPFVVRPPEGRSLGLPSPSAPAPDVNDDEQASLPELVLQS